MSKLTKAQRIALTNARDFGNALAYRAPQVGGHMLPWHGSKRRMLNALISAGLLNRDGELTQAGSAAIV